MRLWVVKCGGVMKNRLSNLVKKAIAPVALVVAMAAFSPITAMAQNRGGREGGRGGERSNAASNRGNFNGARSFSDRGHERGGNFNRGNQFSERRSDSRFRDDRDFRGDRGYNRPGFRVGVGIYPSYRYVAPVCAPAGFYDQWGNWQYYPGCVSPYGY
jgi:hypothetical protein